MTNTKIELPKEKQELFNELVASYGSGPVTEPIWIDGKTINEPLFAEEFLKTHKLAYCEGAFFSPDGRLDDPEPLRAEVFEILRPYVATNISKKVSNVIEVIKMSAYRPDLPLETDRIHLANGTLFLNGEFREGKGEIVRSRLPVRYDPEAPLPLTWLRFLNKLFYPEDQMAIQEYIGYCLIPVTKAQRMLIIKGRGGEGKSQFGNVVMKMFGSNARDGSIDKVAENRFACADLENILIMIDDDMKTDRLRDTSRIKRVVTAQGPVDLERKREQSHQGTLYVWLIALSNDDLQALFDKSDGFYRRQLIIETRPRDESRQDDPFIAEKMCGELEGILLWACEGLLRLIGRNYRFTESERAIANREYVRRDANNVIPFMESEGYIRFSAEGSISATKLYQIYTFWCEENAFVPLRRKSFSSVMIANQEKYHVQYDNRIHNTAGRRVWGFHGIEAVIDPHTGSYYNDFSRTYVPSGSYGCREDD